ncbi:MAG: hypothetical protein M3137_10735, partial [Actinomycetota bacterium]|nr:hypothetical protein [Actinomycetota bacterium]
PPPAPPSSAAPASVGLAVAPAPPGNPRAAGSASAVTVTWAAGVEPDLAGYTVTRNDVAVFSCGLHGAPLPNSVPCGASLAYTDHPNIGGMVGYAVVAKRFGLDGNPAHDLTSLPAATSIRLGSGGIAALPPIPVIGNPFVAAPVAPPTSAPVTGSPSVPATTVDPGSGSLEYGPQSHAAAIGARSGTEPGHGTDVTHLALVAAGLLVLALAAHLLYLRGAVARFQLAHGAPLARSAHRRRMPAVRIQWSQWPPLVRDGSKVSPPG